MQKEEIRLGNWVSNRGHEVRVTNPDSPYTLSPILLTEEWLEKFGMVKLGDSFYFWKGSGWNLDKSHKGWYVYYISSDLGIKIKYVHDLYP
jgi:hypothetical protein